jgi:DNA-binding MarR family transcriptional regulator
MNYMKDINTIHAKAYFNLLKASSWVEQNVKEALKSYGITHAQLNALHILYNHHPEAVSANDVKNKILVSNPDVTRLLDRLVNKGYVTRQTCSANRRKIDISLTKNGIELYKKAHQATKSSVANFFEDKITENDAAELRKILHKILK